MKPTIIDAVSFLTTYYEIAGYELPCLCARFTVKNQVVPGIYARLYLDILVSSFYAWLPFVSPAYELFGYDIIIWHNGNIICNCFIPLGVIFLHCLISKYFSPAICANLSKPISVIKGQ